MQGSGLRVYGLGFTVLGLEFRGSGFKENDSEFGVEG